MTRPANIRQSSAFGLSEILVTIAVVLLLASLGVGAWRFANEKTVRNSCVMSHASILRFLDVYHEELHDYPAPAHPDETVTIDGRAIPVGGAAMLYQIMTGDGTDQVGTASQGGTPSDGTTENDEPSTIAWGFEGAPWRSVDGHWFLADALGQPFQYQKGGTPDAVNTTTFDLWSYGGDLETAGKRDLATKQDPVKTARWIKNFPLNTAEPR